ncbi:hypothetical protein FDA25_02420 [Clostridium botulinum]|nr:AIPR family protein [Clostridium botulinum]NFH71469.1 hypothetical protein [Clostridium botulinum]NFI79772.1 hypothetical protein [Clostridium botulinum]NFJ70919.1 hypothetical protein [Clostridium botulinum]NFN62973.1 hypothetical protein [Clostridium botulinum]
MIDIKKGEIKYEVLIDKGVSVFTTIKNVIGIGYKYTEAGSNPREFQGMTSTNIKILESILEDYQRFWAKHLGISITIKGALNNFIKNENKGVLKYEDACITNGLQTLSLFRILLMIKIFQLKKRRADIHTKITKGTEKGFIEIINEELSSMSEFFLSSINISQINKIFNWIHKEENKKYLVILNKLSINDILNIKISFKAVFLEEIINSEEENEIDIISKWGANIADSNNETQNVKEDDKFGTKYSQWFNDNIMKDVNEKIIYVEYRKYSYKNKELPIKHILDILRAIIPTTLIVDCKNNNDSCRIHPANMISKYANNRTPIFNVFDKLITIVENKKNTIPKEISDVINIITNLMPILIEIMIEFEYKLNLYYKTLTFDEISKTYANEEELKIKLGLQKNETNKEVMDKAVKMKLRFSPSNVLPLFIFATRKAININEKLKVEYKIGNDDMYSMIISIYKKILKQRLEIQYGSTSDLFRNPQLYIDAEDSYAIINKYKKQEDYTSAYRINLAEYQI